MDIMKTLKLLKELSELLQTPNLSKENIDAINHTMFYMIDSLHRPVVTYVDKQKQG